VSTNYKTALFACIRAFIIHNVAYPVRRVSDSEVAAFFAEYGVELIVNDLSGDKFDATVINLPQGRTRRFDAVREWGRAGFEAARDWKRAGVDAVRDWRRRAGTTQNYNSETSEHIFIGNPIIDRDGNTLSGVFMPDTDNTVVAGLLRQHDEAFRNPDGSRHGISRGGCNYMTVLAFAQMVSGQSFTSDQILNIWNTVEDSVMSTTYGTYGWVYDSDELARIALDALGRTDIEIRFFNQGATNTSANDIFIGYRMGMPTPHFVVGNTAQEEIWNPGNANDPITRMDRVYLRVR